MAMPCPEKMAQLPIDDRYKQAIAAFCSDPQNESACQLLCDAPPDVIIQKFEQVEDELASYVEEGVPPDLAAVAQQQAPEFAQMAGQFLQEKGPDILAQERSSRQPQGFARGGLASLGRFGDRNIAHVQKGEMVVPNHVLNDTPGLRAELSALMARRGADPARYTVGGRKASYNPRTGQQEFFSLGGIIGGVVGFAVGGPIGAAIGAGAGTMVDTGDPLEALGMAAAGFGLGTFAAGAGFGAGALGTGTTASQGLAASEGVSALAVPASESALASEIGLLGAESFSGMAPAAIAPTTAGVGGGVLGGGAVTGGELMMGGLAESAIPTASTMFPAAATAPAATTAASTGGSTFLGNLGSSAADWWKNSSMLEKAGALSLGSTVLGATGMLDAEQPQRPAGYDLQTDPSAKYGGKEYETLGPEDLFGNIDQYGSGIPGSPGNPLQYGAAISAPSGYSYAQELMQYGSPVNMQAQKDAYNYSVAPYGNVPRYVANGGHVRGPGTPTSDSIPAYLSDGEFVMTTKAVRGAGNGSLRDGAKRLYAMMDELERRA